MPIKTFDNGVLMKKKSIFSFPFSRVLADYMVIQLKFSQS